MVSRIVAFQFGRLNLVGTWNDKREFLFKCLSAGIPLEIKQFKYAFFTVQELTEDNEAFAFGRLVKYKSELEEEVVDETTHQLSTDSIPLGVVAKSDFFLHYRSGVIAYRPITNKLSSGQFREVYARLIEKANDNFFVNAEIQPIGEQIEIEEALKRFQIIYRIVIDLHPSNPSNREVWQRVDQRIKAIGANRLREIVDAIPSNGFDLRTLQNDDAYRGVLMAADGYGKAEVIGKMDNVEKIIRTEDSPTETKVTIDDDPRQTLAQLIQTFRHIWGQISE